MTSLWVTGVVLAVLVLGWLARRMFRQAREAEAPAETDIPLWEAEEHNRRDFWPEVVGQIDDTAPAVLTPPEWTEPKPIPNEPPRRFDR